MLIPFNNKQLIKLAIQREYKLKFFNKYFLSGYIHIDYLFKTFYFCSTKLFIYNLTSIIYIQIIAYRSSYKRLKKLEKLKQRFLWNLFFALRCVWFKLILKNNQTILESSKGWLIYESALNPSTQLELYSIYNFLLYKVLKEKYQISLTRININWLSLRPYSWVTIRLNFQQLWTFKALKAFELNKYWTLDGDSHYLQYRILCYLPTSKKILKSKLDYAWFLKVIVLRLNKYPVVCGYYQLKALTILNKLGYQRNVSLTLFIELETIWQANPFAVDIIFLLKFISKDVIREDIMTDFIIQFWWLKFLRQSSIFSYCLRYDLIFISSYRLLGVLLRRLKISLIK